MISYSLFLEYVKDNILSYMPQEYAEYHVNQISTVKENDLVLEGISVVKSGDGIQCAPIFYCEEFYRQFQETQDIQKVMRTLAELCVYWDREGRKMQLPDVTNFNEIKFMIGYSIANERLSRDMLEEVVYETIEDLAKVYRVFMLDDDGCKSLKITNELMERWGVTKAQLRQLADENMPRMFPPRIESMDSIARQIINLEELQAMFPPQLPSAGKNMYMLSNEQICGGASVIFYPGLLEKVGELMKSDFFILPASTEEVYIIRSNPNSAKYYGEIVRDGNTMFCEPIEVLSDCIYEYNRESGKIRKVPESELVNEKHRGMER